MKWDVGIGLGIAGLGVGLVLGVPPQWWSDMPTLLVRSAVALGVLLVLAGLGVPAFRYRPLSPQWGPLIVMLTGAAMLLAGTVWWVLMPRGGRSEPPAGAEPSAPPREAPVHPQKPLEASVLHKGSDINASDQTAPQPPAVMFDLSGNAEASIGELNSRGDAVAVARMTGGKLTIGTANVTGPNAPPVQLSPPPPEVMILSNEGLRARLRQVARELRAYQAEVDVVVAGFKSQQEALLHDVRLSQQKRTAGMDTIWQKMNVYREEGDQRFKLEFRSKCVQLLAAVIQRIGPIIPPPRTLTSYSAYEKNQSIAMGMSSISSGNVMGEPTHAADFLDFAAGLLP